MTLLLTTSGNSWDNWNLSWAQTTTLSHIWEHQLQQRKPPWIPIASFWWFLLPRFSSVFVTQQALPGGNFYWTLLLLLCFTETVQMAWDLDSCQFSAVETTVYSYICCPASDRKQYQKLLKQSSQWAPKSSFFLQAPPRCVAFSQGGPRRSKISSL